MLSDAILVVDCMLYARYSSMLTLVVDVMLTLCCMLSPACCMPGDWSICHRRKHVRTTQLKYAIALTKPVVVGDADGGGCDSHYHVCHVLTRTSLDQRVESCCA